MPHYKNLNNELFWLDEGDDPQKWLSDCVQITDAEAVTIRAATQQAAFNALTCSQKRAAEYPPITDYIDGVVKGDQAQIDKYIADCLAVKAKYPKEQA